MSEELQPDNQDAGSQDSAAEDACRPPSRTRRRSFKTPYQQRLQMIRELERKTAKLQSQLDLLELEHRRLQHSERLLLLACASLDQLVALNDAESPATAGAVTAAAAAACADLSCMSFDALERLPCLPGDGEPCDFFQELMARPPFPGVQALGLAEALADYRSTMLQLSLRLHLLDRPTDVPGESEALTDIKRILARHYWLLATVMRARPELLEAMATTNTETGEQCSEPCLARTAWVLEQLGLTAQQREAIRHGVDLFARLLAPITEERRRLQLTFSAGEAAPLPSEVRWPGQAPAPGSSASSGGSPRAGRAAGPARSGGSAGGGSCASLADRMAALQDAVDRLLRLEQLMGKETLTRLSAAAGVLGCMSWTQLARFNVLHSPMPAQLTNVALVLLAPQPAAPHGQGAG